jgi:GntR family transcriptional regulator, rspAB operon transcriptional repressor
MSVDLIALQTTRLADSVYELLRERILSGGFLPGEKLNVDLLAHQLGTSHTPIKVALAKLAAEGIVQIQPRRGTYVTRVAEREISEVLAIRRAMELLAAETIVDHITDQDFTELEKIVRQIEQAADVDTHAKKNAELHRRMVELSGNQTLADLYNQLHAHIHIALIHARSTTWRSRSSPERIEHRAILDALKQRDSVALQTAFRQHLSRSRDSLLSDIQSQSGKA